MTQTQESTQFGCDKVGIWSDQMVAYLSFLKVRRRCFLTLSALLAVKLSSTSYGTPLKLKNSNLLHAKVGTLFKTIIFGIRAKFPRPNESYFGILGSTRQNAFHHVDMSKIFVEYGGKSQTCFRAGNTAELAERKWEGAGRSLLYILDSVHPGLKITFER